MANNDMNNFIGLSAVLTGFSADILAPQLDPVNIKAEYLPFFTAKVSEESGNPNLASSIFSKFASLQSQTDPKLSPQQIGASMLDPGNGDAFVLACRKLIFMWYSGAWPTVIPATASAPATTVSDMISAKSYTCGLAWQVMQSHPMGDSNYRYGYWAKTPAALSEYTGN
ncbi:hypothetical protein [Cellvibrio japonicus]|uniref:Sorbitol dehydrogenase n=1 Tax=Cellvibrio japonicus (strain Ueda107) TaxID=498211 RepID=B3PDD7_CELJU|nr:hypothetical protein [Cellvibrio japonicus]ACE85003.1 hypothetical protein CJA_3095 [Cellvibrio japonicus Ueda107]QEI13385.1 hypothetical protein FY117_14915 [Cellvibrio japonicus]QEI16959.1 hypothetical protein FY116_14920 [Cellvibrio japonicus]QEI20537.1 hypothetical protein FY115_14915 [Cellvibrio japonicus]